MDSRATVLVVDDDAAVRGLLRALLEDEFQVEEAPNGMVALVQAWDVRPDVIVLDRDMPAMDGAEAAPYLRILSPKSAIVAFSGALSATPAWADAFAQKTDAVALVGLVQELASTPRQDTLWLQLQARRQDLLQAG